MMEAASTSETSVNFYQTRRRNNPEDSHLHDKYNFRKVSSQTRNNYRNNTLSQGRMNRMNNITTPLWEFFLPLKQDFDTDQSLESELQLNICYSFSDAKRYFVAQKITCSVAEMSLSKFRLIFFIGLHRN
jgi:hypothetical protein